MFGTEHRLGESMPLHVVLFQDGHVPKDEPIGLWFHSHQALGFIVIPKF
jgi:proteasome lid subunit RPN8/RPN11